MMYGEQVGNDEVALHGDRPIVLNMGELLKRLLMNFKDGATIPFVFLKDSMRTL